MRVRGTYGSAQTSVEGRRRTLPTSSPALVRAQCPLSSTSEHHVSPRAFSIVTGSMAVTFACETGSGAGWSSRSKTN